MTFPLHRLVWQNRHRQLGAALGEGQHDLEELDPRGRTPLHLAISLGHLESARVLLSHGAEVSAENLRGWTALQEAVSTGDPELVELVLQYRDYQRASRRLAGIPELLRQLRRAPNFYVEMKWEFTSWVPLVSRICPSDVYRVWKSGANLRVDTTLLGFNQLTWQRGNRSYIFKGEEDGAVVMEVDHDKRLVFTETLSLALHNTELVLSAMLPSEDQVASRLTSPIIATHLDTKNIAFERNKSGIWGWRSERSEIVHGYQAKVFSANNVDLVTKTRTEHLSDPDKAKIKGTRTPLQSFLGLAEQHVSSPPEGGPSAPSGVQPSPSEVTAEQYFDPEVDLQSRDIGRPLELSLKVQRFKATLWLCEDYPLSLSEQLSPIVDLMAISNTHFGKLRDFISLRLPPGFPVKIEIPLFHMLNARITFGNLCGSEEAVSSLSYPARSPTAGREGGAGAESGRRVGECEVAPSVFEVPAGYSVRGSMGRPDPLPDEDDELLQFAIQQSLLGAGPEADQVTIWEALSATRTSDDPAEPYDEEAALARAIRESLAGRGGGPGEGARTAGSPGSLSRSDSYTAALQTAMEESHREQEEWERQLSREEDEIQRILRLSLTDK
ncbi:ankyrin repeat domain-containing protein 13D-like [Mobula hypostoma]|uniref:ankyrin repeat domain-containing protein 13D-like n=1 Tax=Mobula hypostoma TaxID=723540 RepID=UPI002FC2D788